MHGVNERFDFRAEVPDLTDLGRVHFIAIGGAGMSAVARIMLARGVTVTGSDAKDSPMLRALEREGATTWVGHNPSHVDGADTVVISSAIRESNVELIRARELGLPVLHRAQALASTMTGAVAAAVAGANGKTTTTSMLTVALQAAGLDPSFASGGELADQGTNARWCAGAPFVVEADESDGSFLVYRPAVAVVTNVQPDHLDFYGTFEGVQTAYAEFVASMPRGGLLVACRDDDGSSVLAQDAAASGVRVLTYGFAEDADLRVHSVKSTGLGSTARFVDQDGVERTLHLAVPGRHNVLNAMGAYLAAVAGLGAESAAVLKGLAHFGGARRRFEVRGEVGGVTVVDDYAHNPGKVAAVVATAAEIAHARGGHLRVIFQPHLYSRTNDFATDFALALAAADEVVLLEIYGAREEPVPGVGSHLVADALLIEIGGTGGKLSLGAHGVTSSVPVLDRGEAVAALVTAARPGDLLMTIGAGDVTELADALTEGLRQR